MDDMKTPPSLKKVFAAAALIGGMCAMAITAGIGSAIAPTCEKSQCIEFHQESRKDFKIGATAAVIGGVALLVMRKKKR